jgi:hypothetical protein
MRAAQNAKKHVRCRKLKRRGATPAALRSTGDGWRPARMGLPRINLGENDSCFTSVPALRSLSLFLRVARLNLRSSKRIPRNENVISCSATSAKPARALGHFDRNQPLGGPLGQAAENSIQACAPSDRCVQDRRVGPRLA